MGLSRFFAAMRDRKQGVRDAVRRAYDMLGTPLHGDFSGRSSTAETRYFVHIPKTAGMTVHDFLRRSVPAGSGPHRLFKGFFLHEVVADLEMARRCTVFSGHFLGFLDPLLGRSTRKATLLRDPVDRAISHFLHVRRDPKLPFHEEFRTRSLTEVLSHPTWRLFAVNVQARYLAALADDPAWLDHTMQTRSAACDDATLLARARAGLAMIEVVGLHERLPDFLNTLAAKWSIRGPTEIPWVNVAENRAGIVIRDEEKALLRELNRVDQALYEEAAERTGRLAAT